MLNLIKEIIDISTSRGAFRGAELSQIGAVYDSINSGLEKGFELTKKDLDKVAVVPVETRKDSKILEEEGTRV